MDTLQKLNLLRECVVGIHDSTWNFGRWFSGGCGCAAGHFSMTDEGKKLGLRVSTEGTLYELEGKVEAEALVKVFDIDYFEAYNLFLPQGYAGYPNVRVTKETFLERLDSLIERYSSVA